MPQGEYLDLVSLGKLAFTAFAGAGPYPINGLDYLSTDHLSVTVNAVLATASFDDAKKTMTLAATPAAGSTIVVQRTTPRLPAGRLTQFLDLPTGQAGLTAGLLDQDARQNMLLMGEGRDVADGLADNSGMGLDDGTLQWDGLGLKVQNLTVASTPSSAVRKSQLDAVVAAARPLPTVSGADNDDGLFVTAGEFAKRTPAQARAHLGLGTVATLAAGTSATNVAQFDPSARYPTADGRNIDLTNHAIQTEINKRARATVLKLTRLTQGGNTVDPTLSTWSQNASSRIAFNGATWTNRIELNNSGDIDGNISPGRFDLSAGTWRIRWFFRARATPVGGANTRFGITNNNDTSGQTVYLDTGVFRIRSQFSGTNNVYAILLDELIIANASPFSLVFRWALVTTAANNDLDIGLFFHKISTSVLA